MKKSKKVVLSIDKLNGKKVNNLNKIKGGNAELVVTIDDDIT
jgi:hypothetical protein